VSTIFIHAAVGAAEGVVAGGVGFVVDGAYPAASAELGEITTAAEQGEAGGLTRSSFAWTEEGEEMVRPRVAGRNLPGNLTRSPSRVSLTFLAKTKGSFIKAYKAGLKVGKEILTTKRGMKRYLIKKLGVSFSLAVVVDAPMKASQDSAGQAPTATEDAIVDDDEAGVRPLFMNVQGSIGEKGIAAVLGHMHIATTETEPGDSREGLSSYAYVTHSSTERSLLYVEDAKSGEGFHIRVSSASGKTNKDRYLAVADNHPKDRRDANSLYVNAHDGYPGATWALEIYEEVHAVLRLVSPGTASGRPMNGGYLVAHLDTERDGRQDGGCYLAVAKAPTGGDDVASMFGFRFMSQDQLWWMDVVGDYECHVYDAGGKNNSHYVSIAESIDHQGLYWTNKSRAFYRLTAQVGTRDTLLTQNDCSYFTKGHKECKVIYDSDQNVIAVLGPWNERYDRLWWRDLEGMLFESHEPDGDGDGYISFTRSGETTEHMNVHVDLRYRARQSLVVKGSYKDRNVLNFVGRAPVEELVSTLEEVGSTLAESMAEMSQGVSQFFGTSTGGGARTSTGAGAVTSKGDKVLVIRDSFGLVIGLKMTVLWTLTPHEMRDVTFYRYSLTDLLGRYVTQAYDNTKKKLVSTYMSIHGSPTGKNEVWWQSTNGETWSLQHMSRNKLAVGKTCPYLQDGYTMCVISRNDIGQVESLSGPNGKSFKRI
jgi:hypothetical protein